MGSSWSDRFFHTFGLLSNYKYSKSGDIVSECVCAFAKFMVKFYPLYICITLLWSFIKPWSGVDLIKAIFMSQSYWGSVDTAMIFNGNTWFLSSLMFSYVLSPVINRFINESKCITVILVTILVIIIHVSLPFIFENEFQYGYYWVYIFPPTRAIDFYYGSLLCNILNRKTVKISSLFGLIFTSLYLMELLFINDVPVLLLRYDIMWIPLSLCFLVFFYNHEVKYGLLIGQLKSFGKVSFEIFLCHRMILIFVAKVNKDFCGLVIAFILTYLLSNIMRELNVFSKIFEKSS